MFGLAANSIFFIVFSLSGSLAMALIARFLAGAGNGNIAVAKAYIDITKDDQVASRMGCLGRHSVSDSWWGHLSAAFSPILRQDSGPFDSSSGRLPISYFAYSRALSTIALFSPSSSCRPSKMRSKITRCRYHSWRDIFRNNIRDANSLHSSLVNVNFLFLIGFTDAGRSYSSLPWISKAVA